MDEQASACWIAELLDMVMGPIEQTRVVSVRQPNWKRGLAYEQANEPSNNSNKTWTNRQVSDITTAAKTKIFAVSVASFQMLTQFYQIWT